VELFGSSNRHHGDIPMVRNDALLGEALSFIDSNGRPPYGLLVFGGFLLLLAAVGMFTGKTWVRLHGWVDRAEEPNYFWWQVAFFFLAGLGFIGYYLYQAYGL
jgi:hypothetical protein